MFLLYQPSHQSRDLLLIKYFFSCNQQIEYVVWFTYYMASKTKDDQV